MIHKEGFVPILLVFVFSLSLIFAFNYFNTPLWLNILLYSSLLILNIFVIQFFKNPKRIIENSNDKFLTSPADGKIVVIEQTFEKEFYKDKVWQISIYMSPLNVHSNKIPIGGEIIYQKHHKGKFLLAKNPKSSELNERNTIVVKSQNASVLIRQIAGAMARRIKCYAKVGDNMIQGDEYGFIKFGSRVDVFLPLQSHISVSLNQKVKANITKIAQIR